MNDRQLENKVYMDAENVIKDTDILVGDSAVLLGRYESNVGQATVKAKEDLATWVGDGVSNFGEGVEKLTGDAKETVVVAAAAVKKDVGRGLEQYNTKAQEVADQVPGDFSKKVARYPWVAITVTLAFGFLLGGLFKQAQHRVWQH
jgi:hypothetical protein